MMTLFSVAECEDCNGVGTQGGYGLLWPDDSVGKELESLVAGVSAIIIVYNNTVVSLARRIKNLIWVAYFLS